MQISVVGRGIRATKALRSYVESKVKKLEKYIPKATEAVVTLRVEKYRHIAEILIKGNKTLIQAEGESNEMYTSIDNVMNKIVRQLKKYKEKRQDHKGKQKGIGGVADIALEEEKSPQIVKVKRFPMKPMFPDEAIMQMELLKKNFFVFSNASNEKVNVIYKLEDGNVGLIEPIY